MTNSSPFDSFLTQLSGDINQSPHLALTIIQRAVSDTACPYLKDKIREIQTHHLTKVNYTSLNKHKRRKK